MKWYQIALFSYQEDGTDVLGNSRMLPKLVGQTMGRRTYWTSQDIETFEREYLKEGMKVIVKPFYAKSFDSIELVMLEGKKYKVTDRIRNMNRFYTLYLTPYED